MSARGFEKGEKAGRDFELEITRDRNARCEVAGEEGVLFSRTN